MIQFIIEFHIIHISLLEHLSIHSTSNLEVDEQQQQKNTSGSIPVSQEQESEVIMDIDSLKPDR